MELQNLFPLTPNLEAHTLNFSSDEVEVWHVPLCENWSSPYKKKIEQKCK
jgi:hypothetical protein